MRGGSSRILNGVPYLEHTGDNVNSPLDNMIKAGVPVRYHG